MSPFFTIFKFLIVIYSNWYVQMMKWIHVKNELIHQNIMLKFHGQIFGIQFVTDF